MNCEEFRKQYIDLMDADAPIKDRNELKAHLESCPACAQLFQEITQTASALRPSLKISASPKFKERVMNTILELEEKSTKPIQVGKSYGLKTFKILLAAALLLAIVGIFSVVDWTRQQKGQPAMDAFTLLARAADNISRLKTFHIAARMRTLPNDNFDLIGANYEFVPLEIWKVSGNPSLWRVEKPGRIVVMDGATSTLWIKNSNLAAKSDSGGGFIGSLDSLLYPFLVNYDNKIQITGIEKMTSEMDKHGKIATLTLEFKAHGNFANEWLKNTSFAESDHRRIYRFDPETGNLKEFQIYIQTEKGDVLVFESTSIQFGADLDLDMFTLDLPSDVAWLDKPSVSTDNPKFQEMKPDEAARAFFEAFAERNWDKVLEFYPVSSLDQRVKDYLGGLEIVSIGKPFQSGIYPGWFVPYEIKMKDGSTKKFNLSLRKDNPAGRWEVDGGF